MAPQCLSAAAHAIGSERNESGGRPTTHKRYGKIVRLAPNLVSSSDLSVINEIYGIGTKFQKSPFYELSQAHDDEGLLPDPFILTNKELHSRMKRNASNAYSLNGLVQMEPWIEPVTQRLIEKLRLCAANGEAVDFGMMLANYFMDGVFALTFGRDFNDLDRGDVLEISKMMAIASWYMAVVSLSHASDPDGLGYDNGIHRKLTHRIVWSNHTIFSIPDLWATDRHVGIWKPN